MRKGSKWLRLLVAGLLAGSLALAGCSGDDGDDGAMGPPGPAGPAGPAGADATAGIVAPQTSETAQCVTCHTSFSAAALQVLPFGDEITERFKTSRHANQSARAGFCSACHSHEGGKELLAMGRFVNRVDLEAAYTSDLAVYNLPVGSSTIVGVNKKTCSTCHTTSHYPTNPGLRGDGDVLASAAVVAGFPVAAGTPVDGEVRTAYSAEFNLCTACHTVDLDATWDATAGYNSRGMILYELSAAYTSANLFNATTGTIDLSKAPFYHDGASGVGRTFVDTHFGGTIMEHLVKFNASSADIVIKGYNINPGYKNACTICHDPHTAGKMLSVQAGQGDNNNNLAIGYAEAVGDFHTGYTKDTFSRNQTGCNPCHTGIDFVKVTNGATSAAERWNVVGCRSCHDLAVPNAGPGANNAAAFAQVREFPAGYQFKFNSPSAAVVPVAQLGVNQICFECHKGRIAGANVAAMADPAVGTTNYAISYLHYAPSMAILFGNDSKMVATYPGKTYAGRFTHPVPNAAGSNAFGCVDCHDVHDTHGNHASANKMENPAYTCNACHNANAGNLSVASLQARTEAYSVRLLSTILTAMQAVDTTVAPGADLNAALKTKIVALQGAYPNATFATAEDELMNWIEQRQVFFPNKTIAHAATTWKVFTYEDGAVHGQTHGHGGSWAHNSRFARQVMFDAIESLGGSTVGLSRPL